MRGTCLDEQRPRCCRRMRQLQSHTGSYYKQADEHPLSHTHVGASMHAAERTSSAYATAQNNSTNNCATHIHVAVQQVAQGHNETSTCLARR